MSVQAPKITAVIVSYHSRGTIDHALERLQHAHRLGLVKCVVVDNASRDGTPEYIAENFPWVTLIRSPDNLGFGRGCNLGFESVDTPYVLLLNPDAAIDNDALEVLVAFLENHPDAAMIAPATELSEGYQEVGLLLTPSGLIRTALGDPAGYPDRRTMRPGDPSVRTSWICGAIMLIRSSMFRDLGGFDPRFFLYYEETDLCLRAAQAGMEIWATGQAAAKHIGAISAQQTGGRLSSGESGELVEFFYPSRLYYLKKNFGWFRAYGAESIATVLEWMRWLRRALTRRVDPPGRIKRPYFKLPVRIDDR